MTQIFKRYLLLIFGVFSAAGSGLADTAAPLSRTPFEHNGWTLLLQRHVEWNKEKTSTTVNYAGFLREKPQLEKYLNQISRVEETSFRNWAKPEQLAFLINAYNAFTVDLILSRYPSLESIKDLGSFLQSPWKKAFIPLFGKTVSLDDIEHGMIRDPSRFQDPRIHFAVNCASVGCPALRDEAYTGAAIEHQLEEQTTRFLRDTSRNRHTTGTLTVSPIFKWYRKDFESGFRGKKSLEEFLAQYGKELGLTDTDSTNLRNRKIIINFGDYDWRLNQHGSNR